MLVRKIVAALAIKISLKNTFYGAQTNHIHLHFNVNISFSAFLVVGGRKYYFCSV
jgi:hypothetical protein